MRQARLVTDVTLEFARRLSSARPVWVDGSVLGPASGRPACAGADNRLVRDPDFGRGTTFE